MSLVVGADCTRTSRGIIAVSVRDGHLHEVRLHPSLDLFLDATKTADAVVVDLPIGHDDPDGTKNSGRRSCDVAARAFVGPREAEVPLVPPFLVFTSDSLEAACDEAEGQGWPQPAKRLWTVRDRLLALQGRVRTHPNLHEGDPEVSFQALHATLRGEGHLRSPPHYWSGLHERLTLLHEVALRPTRSFGGIGRMNPEDVVAATALAWTAGRIREGTAERFGRDEEVAIRA